MFFELLVFVGLLTYYLYKLGFTTPGNGSKKTRMPPGPYGMPIFGYLPFLGKVPCETIAKLSEKYGKIFTLKLGQYPVVFLHDFDLVKEAYKHECLTGRMQMDLFEKRGQYGLGLLEGKDWQEVRRFMMKCLRDLGFGKRSMESSIMEEVIQTRQFLQKNTNKPLYLKPLIEVAVINALWGMLTGEKYDIEDPAKRKVLRIMSDGIADQNIVGIGAFLPWLAKLLPNLSGYNKGMEYFGAPDNLAREIIDKHIGTYRHGFERDFIDVTLTKIYATTEPSSMFYKEVGIKNLHYTLIDLFFAGSDTMSSTLGWTFLYLSIWPEIQAKVHEEIDRVIGAERLPSTEDRLKMPFTEGVMWEVLRKSSMVPLGLLHTAIEDFEFEGYYFPKRSIFLSNIHFIHNDPKYWGDPENFRPSRFLSPVDGTFQKDEHMIPFFTGKRSCPGESLALKEYFLFLTGILQNLTFSLNPNEPLPDIGPRSGFILPPPKHTLFAQERQSKHTPSL